ncbi:MAG: FkbM family methyltransferase [Nitrospirae bacterium]|nr:FkbM family methyltransferase [Nitrospirota bacterium]MBF0533463.1 FkbM family methyltransferase [Nitrospirota bacterium]MBF0616013.1 FkbM family methyltransferase [Nitrospirota bacterium]
MQDHRERLLQLFDHPSLFNNPTNCVHNLLGNKKIILYGGGRGFIGFSVFILKRYKLKVHAVIDIKFKSGDACCGVPAFSPFDFSPTNDEKENAVVVVTVGKTQYHEEIFNCLLQLGFKNIITATDIYEYHLCHDALTGIGKDGFDYYVVNKDKIVASFDLFKDELSREIYVRFIQTHMQRKPVRIPADVPESQYFSPDIKLNKGVSRFINCGAYDGDTVRLLNNLHGKTEAIVCFEPDPKNFDVLTQYLCLNHIQLARSVVAFPCGVFSHNTQFRFAGGNGTISVISEEGESVIQCVALDKVIPGFNPTLINMDVEGAELEALQGAEALIRESKPDLAISVYHLPNHIWDIPLFVESLKLGYNLFLRNYTSFITDTVLYSTI